jgi:hypothetical protein
VQIVEPMVKRKQLVPRHQPVEPMVQAQLEVILVDRNHDADEVVRNVQQNFVSPLSEYVLQTELPRGYKIPKFTTFAGDTNESTVKHITHYLMEARDIANNENVRLKFFRNSLTKNAFTCLPRLHRIPFNIGLN